MAFKCNVPLQRKIDTLSQKRTNLVAEKISQPASDHYLTCSISGDIVSQDIPFVRIPHNVYRNLRPHKFCRCQFFSHQVRQKCKHEILEYRHTHTEYPKIEKLIKELCHFRMVAGKLSPFPAPPKADSLFLSIHPSSPPPAHRPPRKDYPHRYAAVRKIPDE